MGDFCKTRNVRGRRLSRPLLASTALAATMLAATGAQAQSEVESLRQGIQELEQRLRQLEQRQQQQPAQTEVERLELRVRELEQQQQATEQELAETRERTEEHQEWIEVNRGQLAEATPVSRVTGQADYVTGGDFPGSFRLPGINTSIGIYGFTKADFVHNFDDQRVFPSLLFTALIPVGDQPGSGREGDTNFRVNASQINIETRTPTDWGEAKTHFQFDFFNSDQSVGGAEENTANELPAGLRLAYGKLGPLTVGQDWTTFMDLSSYPETADFEGPNSEIFARIPQIAWGQPVGNGWSYRVGLENPNGNFIPPPGTTVSEVDDTSWPDLNAHVRVDKDWGHVQVSGQVRQIGFDIDPTVSAANAAAFAALPKASDSTVGWGVNAFVQLLDPFGLHERDKLTALGAYGEGIRHIIDTGLLAQQTDGGVNPATGEMETEEQYSAMGWYQHWWSDTTRSTLVYGIVKTDPLSFAPDDHFKRTQYLVGNLFWSPVPRVNFGIEYQYGEKKVKDGRNGEVQQVQATAVFIY